LCRSSRLAGGDGALRDAASQADTACLVRRWAKASNQRYVSKLIVLGSVLR